MTIRPLLFTIVAYASTGFMTASAHPGGHEDEEKLIPTTCAQFADTKRYTNDVAYPQVKTLKARCEAEKTRVTEPGQATTPRSSD